MVWPGAKERRNDPQRRRLERASFVVDNWTMRKLDETRSGFDVGAPGMLANGGTGFDPDHLLDAIKGVFTDSVEAGYSGLRLSTDVP